jgi:histone H3/H4
LWAEETQTVRGIDATYAIGAAGGEAGSGVGADIFKAHNDLPLARIKRIMKSDEDVRMISAEAPVLFAKACELFILDLTIRSFCHAKEERGKRRALTREDVCLAVQQTDVFDFLVGVLLPPGSRPQYIVDAENGVMHPMYDTLAEHALLGGGGGGGGGELGGMGGSVGVGGGGGDISALLEIGASAGNIGLLPAREDPAPTPVPEVSISQSSNAKKGGGGEGGGSKAKKGKKGS